MASVSVDVRTTDIDLGAEAEALRAATPGAGALVTFTGICRDEDGRLAALELEHYAGMAEAELTRIATRAADRWGLAGVRIVHRYGVLRPGDTIVLAATASRHRQAALEAASFMMDYLKTQAPFWKKEHPADGREGDWVAARESDDEAAAKW